MLGLNDWLKNTTQQFKVIAEKLDKVLNYLKKDLIEDFTIVTTTQEYQNGNNLRLNESYVISYKNNDTIILNLLFIASVVNEDTIDNNDNNDNITLSIQNNENIIKVFKLSKFQLNQPIDLKILINKTNLDNLQIITTEPLLIHYRVSSI